MAEKSLRSHMTSVALSLHYPDGMKCLIQTVVVLILMVMQDPARAEHQAAVIAPPTPQPGVERPADKSESLAGSVILDVFPDANSSPTTLTELNDKLVNVSHLKFISNGIQSNYVVHSNAPSKTSAAEPRMLYATDGGELYIGAIKRLNGTYEVEFIAWNRNRNAYDFGIVENFGTPQAKAMLANRQACLRCHITEGPHYMSDDWRSTQEKLENRRAVMDALVRNDARYSDLREPLAAVPAGKDHFEDTQVQEFFRAHPSLILMHGIDLNRNGVEIKGFENNASTARNFEGVVVHGAIRATVARYVESIASDDERKKTITSLMRMQLNETVGETPSADDVALSRKVAESPFHVPVLFDPKIPLGQPLKKTDFQEHAYPLLMADDVDNVINNGTDPLHRRTRALFDLDTLDTRRAIERIIAYREGRPYKEDMYTTNEERQRAIAALLETPDTARIIEEKRIPTLGDFSVATRTGTEAILNGWKPAAKVSTPGLPDKPASKRSAAEEADELENFQIRSLGACLSCHKSMTGDLRFDFRVESAEAWKQKYESAQENDIARLNHLRAVILKRLQNKADPMPPEDSKQWKHFSDKDREKLIEYLKSGP